MEDYQAATTSITLSPWPDRSRHPLQHLLDEAAARQRLMEEGDRYWADGGEEEGEEAEPRPEPGPLSVEEYEGLPFVGSYQMDGLLVTELGQLSGARLVQRSGRWGQGTTGGLDLGIHPSMSHFGAGSRHPSMSHLGAGSRHPSNYESFGGGG